jgi:phage FluMu protein Com
MINFHCQKCGQKIVTDQVHAGKKAKCPKCKNIVVIPTTANTNSDSNRDDFDLTGFDFDKPPKYRDSDETPGQLDLTQLRRKEVARAETSPGRKLPRILEIFLYPASLPGMITIGVLLGIRIAVDLAVIFLKLLSMYCAPFFLLVLFAFYAGILIKIILLLFFFWYFCECVRDSAFGGLRAPETIANPPGPGDLFRVGFVWLVFWGPLIIYSLYKYPPFRMFIAIFTLPQGYSAKDIFVYIIQNDGTLWLLLFWAIYFFPISLLAVSLFESFSALNPILIIGSIFSTFFRYFGIVLIFHVPIIFIFASLMAFPRLAIGLPGLAYRLVCAYLFLVMGHLLGRFYYRNAERLCWEV